MGNEITFEVMEHYGVISATDTGWSKEVNLVAWNGNAPKIDIRDWDETHERMSRGITLTEEQGKKLYEILKNKYEG